VYLTFIGVVLNLVTEFTKKQQIATNFISLKCTG